NVQGIGWMFIRALNAYDTPMIVAVVTTFAYLLAITVFIVDVCYAFVDPRIRIGSQKRQGRAVAHKRGRFGWLHSRSATAAAQQTAASKSGRRFSLALPRIGLGDIIGGTRRLGSEIRFIARAMRRYPSAIFGLLIIGGLLAVSVYTVTTIPYAEAIKLWRGDDNVWSRNPRDALPSWVNYLRINDLPSTMVFSSATNDLIQITEFDSGGRDVSIPFTFTYDYGDFPQEIILDMTAQYEERGPHITVTWVWPDGRERELTSFLPNTTETYYVSRDTRLQRRLRSDVPQEMLFLDAEGNADGPVAGTYTLRIDVLHFEPDSDFDVDVTMLGQVYGLAGTDSQRRDLMIAVLWGTPIALAFGLIAAFATSVGGMLVAALGAWYGGMVDRIVQFLTEVNLILPFFPISLMVFVLYSRSIVTILAVTVALTIFGSSVKTYRATFLQVRTSPYIEAARAYGASNWRIVIRYMIPRIVTVLVPKLIILVPSYVFLEATLAFLGVTDPYLPTWGKLVVTALSYGVHTNSAHLVIAPLGLLFFTGFAFAMVGTALERIFEPRLRDM
ncbi:MAG: ABC transporter permease subunit, partial [Anaerolineales bacterium]|nr:ABC transporter permease subunit [Anaerolineales bacterium]